MKLLEEKDLAPSPSILSSFVPHGSQRNINATLNLKSNIGTNIYMVDSDDIDKNEKLTTKESDNSKNISLSFGNLFLHRFG